MLLIAFRCMFFAAVIFGYSAGIWRLINEYFGREFKSFLDEEVKKNRHILVDPLPTSGGGEAIPAGVAEPPNGKAMPGTVSEHANQLLDEMIAGFGRVFESSSKSGSLDDSRETIIVKKEKFATASPAKKQENLVILGEAAMPIASSHTTKSIPAPTTASPVVQLPEATEDHNDDEEEKWISYWKNRPKESPAAGADEQQLFCQGAAATTTTAAWNAASSSSTDDCDVNQVLKSVPGS